jgi:pyruvate ferredoxin oxidoreductase gamma subunit
MIAVRWHGRGGQGCFTAARLLGAAAVYEGRHALAFPSFGPERRGAPILGFTRIDDRPVTDRSAVHTCTHVVVLDDSLLDAHVAEGLVPGGTLIINTRSHSYFFMPQDRRVVCLDATALAVSVLGKPIVNTAMLGALIAASGIVDIESVVHALENDYGIKNIQQNIALLRQAHAALRSTLFS